MVGVSRAGLAGEAGSVHRRGVAAYLAAHGLASRGLASAGHDAGGPFPVRLEFETDQPTDDVTCHLSDRSRMYVSAKRVCGNDRHLRDTVEQWVAQARELNDGDRLVLAVAEPRGPVRALGAALARRRAGSPTYPVNQERALRVLEGYLAQEPARVRARILDAAFVLKVDAAESGCPEFDLATALIEGTVVTAGDGPRAIVALSESMHTQAGKAFASGLDDWVKALTDAQVVIYSDGKGPAGAAVRARQVALEAHLARLRRQNGVVDLSLLADDLPPLLVANLAEGLRVELPGDGDRPVDEKLLVLARRWTRMLLVGLPGAGKSTALRQLAASLARDELAPVPVLVPLRTVAQRCEHSEAVTLSVLCEIAARDAEAGQRADLAAAIHHACCEGRAILLLDGLDECMNRRPLVADGLRTLLASLPPETGVILATRSSAAPAAARLKLPEARLATPRDLVGVLRQLLQHAASVRVPQSDREHWVAARSAWIEEACETHRDLGSVPLLAVLLVLVAADSTDIQLPSSRARVLMTAVRNSVQRWERHRPVAPEGNAGWPTDEQLLDGYAALGHRLSNSIEVEFPEATTCVSAMLCDRWGLASGPAEELASKILWFWDEHVGVFIRADTDTVLPRSRVFAEIAAAMWATRLPKTSLAEWVTECLHQPDRQTALLLTAELDSRVFAMLLADENLATSEQSVLLAAGAVSGGANVGDEQLAGLMDELAAAAAHGFEDAEDGQGQEPAAGDVAWPDVELDEYDDVGISRPVPHFDTGKPRHRKGWVYVHDLARLPLPQELRDRRQALMDDLPLNEEERAVSDALIVLSDAETDGRKLHETEAERVYRLLDVPLPEKRRPRLRRDLSQRTHVYYSGRSLAPGHGEAVAAAARLLHTLSDQVAQRIHEVARHSSMRVYELAVQALATRGHRFETPGLRNALKPLAEIASAWQPVQELPLLRAATEVSDNETEVPWPRRWRLPDLCDLFSVLGLNRYGVGIGDLLAAVTTDTDETRRAWIRAAAVAAGLDLGAVAAQAQLAIDERQNSEKAILDLLTAPAPRPEPSTDPERLDLEQQQALVGALSAASGWIAHSSFNLLWGKRSETLRDHLMEAMPDLEPSRRRLAAMLACHAARDPVDTAARLYEGTDPAGRAGAVRFLGMLVNPNPRAQRLLTQACADGDLSIRLAAHGTGHASTADPPAARWSCKRCAQYNRITEPHCGHCHGGLRPGEDD